MPVGAIRYFVPDEIAQNAHVFAEIITWGGDRDNEYKLYLMPYMDGLPVSFGAYDFPLLSAIKRAFEFKARLGDYLANPYSDGNALDRQRAVNVVITHDIPYNEGFRSLVMDPKDEELAYAYILGRDGGTPLVFDDGTNKKAYDGRWVGSWKNERMKKMIKFNNRMQGKWMEMLHSDDCVLLWRRREDGIAAINKCDIDKEIQIGTRDKFKWYVMCHEVFTDDDRLRITGEYYRFLIPKRDARKWYAE